MATLRDFMRGGIKYGLEALAPPIYRLLHSRSRKRRSSQLPPEPTRILLLNGAHVGDLIISTSIIPVLRSAYPSAAIGFVVGSWSSMVIADHPDVAFIHEVDHWSINRSHLTLFQKVRQFRKTYKTALKQISDLDYDLALCIFPYFLPNYMELAWRAGIPTRLGFANSVFGSLGTGSVQLPQSPFLLQAALQAEVLRPLSIAQVHLDKRKSVLPNSPKEAIREVTDMLNVTDIQTAKYCIVHQGAGAVNREMPVSFWREIANSLSASQTLVFTGKGPRESTNIAFAIEGIDNCINACDKLSWNGFVAAVRFAQALYGVESMAGHVAAALDTPCFVVYSGVAGVARWRPEGSLSTVFTNHIACAPCGRIQGCHEMTCLKNISPLEILVAGDFDVELDVMKNTQENPLVPSS